MSAVWRKSADDTNSWLGAVALTLILHGLIVAGGIYSQKDSLLELIEQGESVAILPVQTPVVQKELEVDLEVLPEPEPEPNPEFIVPQEAPQPVAEIIPEPEPGPLPEMAEQVPVLPEPALPPLPEPAVAAAPASEVPPAEVPAALTSAASPLPVEAFQEFASQEPKIGNKDFPKPPYPIEAKVKRFEGTVVVSIDVQNGQILTAEVSSSSGYGILDRSATSWIKQRWKFAANVSRTLVQPVSFQLE